MGSGLYGASKAIAVSDLITTVTPERRVEERREEPGKKLPIREELGQPVRRAENTKSDYNCPSY